MIRDIATARMARACSSRAAVATIAAAFLCAAGSRAAAQTPAGDGPTIVAQGEAVMTVVPDRAYVQIAAEGKAAKPADAQRLSATAMTGVQNALKTLGIAPDAIRTTGYTLQPEYDYANGRQVFRDYVARNSVEVRLDDFAKLADVIDSTGASGAASIAGLRFDLKGRDAVEREALQRAVQDGLERARAMATGAGRTLGTIVRIQEQRMSTGVPMYRMAAIAGGAGAPQTPIAPGEIEIRATAMVTVAIR